MQRDLEKIRREWGSLPFPGIFGDAAEYARASHKWSFDYLVARLRMLTAGGGQALDAGSGTGTWSLPLAELFDEVIAVDRNRRRVDLARWLMEYAGCRRVSVSFGDICNLDAADESVDFVFCYGVVISRLPLRQVMREFRRVLRPGGRIYVCLNGRGWSLFLRDARRKKESDKVMGIRSLYNTMCQERHSRINDQLSRVVARYAADDGFRDAVASSMGVTHGAMDRLMEDLMRCEDAAQVRFPSSGSADSASRLTTAVDRMICASERLDSVMLLSDTLETIRKECGGNYASAFAGDVLELISGRAHEFRYWKSGRAYAPADVEKIVNDAGLGQFAWAAEGRLVCTPPAQSGPPPEPIYQSHYAGEIAVWEFTAEK